MAVNKNLKKLTKAYDRLCAITCVITDGMDEKTDVKRLKEAFSAVKEGVNIGQLLAKNETAGALRVTFANGADEYAK